MRLRPEKNPRAQARVQDESLDCRSPFGSLVGPTSEELAPLVLRALNLDQKPTSGSASIPRRLACFGATKFLLTGGAGVRRMLSIGALVSLGASAVGETGAEVATEVHAKDGSSSCDLDKGIAVGEPGAGGETPAG